MPTEILLAQLPALPEWVPLLIVSLITTYTIGLGGWVLARAGRSPLWVLLLLVPYVNLLGIWLFAYVRWPFLPERRDREPA